MFDVCLGAGPSTLAAHVLVTVTTEGAAREIVDVLKKHEAELFQLEGHHAFSRERTDKSAETGKTAAKTARPAGEAASKAK